MDKDRGLVMEEKPIMKMRRKPETTGGSCKIRSICHFRRSAICWT
jgi:hypothetical protein